MAKLEAAVLSRYTRRGKSSVLQLDSSLCEIFHENTKLTPSSSRVYGSRIASTLRSPAAQALMTQPYKIYSLGEEIELPSVRAESDLEKVILARRSQRLFSGEAMTEEELAKLLFFTYGRTAPGGRLRPVASGGALYPLEIYLVANRVSGLERWIYHYNIEHHSLDVVTRRDKWSEVRDSVWLDDMKEPDAAAAILFVTAILQRTTIKYSDRGYRLILIEAGEVAQNLSLVATSLGLGGYLLGGFIDNALSDVLEIDGVDEVPLLPVVLGRPIDDA